MAERIERYEKEIFDQRGEIQVLKNLNDDFKCKGGALSKVRFDELNSKLAIQ